MVLRKLVGQVVVAVLLGQVQMRPAQVVWEARVPMEFKIIGAQDRTSTTVVVEVGQDGLLLPLLLAVKVVVEHLATLEVMLELQEQSIPEVVEAVHMELMDHIG